MRVEIARWLHQVSSPIAEVEVRRAARRVGQPLVRAETVLEPLSFVPLDEPIRHLAGRVGSPILRSLDAIHLATALSLGEDLGGFCCYDRRLLADARQAGLDVLSPGLD